MGATPTVTTAQPTAAQNMVSFICETVCHAGTGAFSAWALTTINPVAGAIFGVTSKWGSFLIGTLNESIKCTNNTPIGKIGAFAMQIIGGISLGVLATTLMSFPLTFTAGLVLTGAWILTGIAFRLIAGACVTSSVIPFAVALAAENKKSI